MTCGPGDTADPRQDITDLATGGSRLLSGRCATCIFHAGDRMYLRPERLRRLIAEALRAGTYVVCHDTLSHGDHPRYGPAAVKPEGSRRDDTRARDLGKAAAQRGLLFDCPGVMR